VSLWLRVLVLLRLVLGLLQWRQCRLRVSVRACCGYLVLDAGLAVAVRRPYFGVFGCSCQSVVSLSGAHSAKATRFGNKPQPGTTRNRETSGGNAAATGTPRDRHQSIKLQNKVARTGRPNVSWSSLTLICSIRNSACEGNIPNLGRRSGNRAQIGTNPESGTTARIGNTD
jgi:hypothetical protein